MSKINYEIKQKVIEIAGICFWYWDNFYAFLENCGIEKRHYKRYEGDSKYKMMRNILTDLEDKNDEKTLKKVVTELYRLKGLPDKNVPNLDKASKVLSELKELCGEDLIEKEIEERKREEKTKEYIQKTKQNINKTRTIQELNDKFLSLFSESNHQFRGYELEKIINELFHHNEFEIHKSYKTENEQIDGYFTYEKFDYLLEIKWVSGSIKQDELAIFDKKIDKKALSTRGLFIAMDGFDENAVLSITGKEPRIILLDGEDLTLILNGNISLKDAMKAKVERLVKKGDTFYKIKNLYS